MPKKGTRWPPEVLTADEVQALVRGCNPRAPTGIRNRALLAVLYRAGLRISEALALKPSDVDDQAGSIRVLYGKGNKARTVGIDDPAVQIILRWLDCRRELGISPRKHLFCTLKGDPLAAAYVRTLLPRLARKAGITKRVHAHGLRHTHAAELMQEGVDVGVISEQLGHTSIATTARYLDHVAPQRVIDTIRQRRTWEP